MLRLRCAVKTTELPDILKWLVDFADYHDSVD